MAGAINILIPPLKPHERIEDWQPLFVAATSALAAHAGEKAAVLILPSYLCRDDYERDVALLSIKEETIEAAFKVACKALDPPIDEFEATARFLKLTWARGVRGEVYATNLWKEARRAGFLNNQVCVVITTQLPSKVHPTLKKWVQGHGGEAVTDSQVREFIGIVQQTLRQADVPLDYGAREVDDKSTHLCKIITQEESADRDSCSSDTEPSELSVCKVRTYVSIRQGKRSPQDTRRANSFTCYTCGKQGHGYRSCPDRVCNRCHKRGHDATSCRSVGRDNYQDRRTSGRRDIKTVDRGGMRDEKAASISVRIQGKTVRALLDTGARVAVMDKQTVDEFGLAHNVKLESSHVYDVSGVPVAVMGSIEIPIEVAANKTEWTHMYVLEGKEQALLLGRQFLKRFGRVVFDWEEGTITLGKARDRIEETAIGCDPITRARSVKEIGADGEELAPATTCSNLTSLQRTELGALLEEYRTLFDDRPGRAPGCEHVIDTGRAAPARTRPNRIPPRWEQEINTQLDEMLAQKLCWPSSSPWARMSC